MHGLTHKHRKSTYHHPTTNMCYRKNSDGTFSFCKKFRLFRKSVWERSGMNTGFVVTERRKSWNIKLT